MSSNKKFYGLSVFGMASIPTFIVDEEDLQKFEDSFSSKEEILEFKDHESDDGVVVLRNAQLIGYKKNILSREYQREFNNKAD